MKKTLTIIIIIIMLTTVSVSIEKAQNTETTNLPPYFSWQDIDGIDYTTPVKDQSPAPTCETYALCASLETLMQYQLGELYGPDLSEAHLYFYPGGTVEAGYVNLMDAADYLIEPGVPDEGCFPDPHRAFDGPFESLPGWENRTVKITDWGWVDHDVEAIKEALIEYGPLIICMQVWEDLYYYFGGVYRHRWGERVGGHVVTIVGYDDSHNCWIVKNSWGPKWGRKGWFKMAYDADLFAEWYGKDTGVMYIDGVHGNLKPDVPKVQIEKPTTFHTYIFGLQFPLLFKKLIMQRAAPQIIGRMYVKLQTENTNKVEFYVDDELQYTDDEAPFKWKLKASPGLHTIDVVAYNDVNISLDIVDVQVII